MFNVAIKEKINATGKSLSSLEREADLKPGIIKNIVYGKSKNPTIGTLKAIAEALDCTVSDLIGEVSKEIGSDPTSKKRENPVPWDKSLYCKTLEQIGKFLKRNELKLSKDEVLSIIEEVYEYSSRKKRKNIDLEFAKWLINKRFT